MDMRLCGKVVDLATVVIWKKGIYFANDVRKTNCIVHIDIPNIQTRKDWANESKSILRRPPDTCKDSVSLLEKKFA
jgi:hypothetical protein